jgi:gliding motility-associated protein GldL
MAFYKSKGFKYVKNLIIGVGAAVVLVGALFKIMGWNGANQMLTVGLLVEAGLFLMLGILPPETTYYWEKVYPGLDEAGEFDPRIGADSNKGKGLGESLDKMLSDSKMDSDSFKRLGDNFAKLNTTVTGMADISNSLAATGDYTNKTQAAASALSKMTEAYNKATTSVADLNSANEGTKKYHEQVQLVTKNLSALNAIYELELNESNSHLKAMNKFYGSMNTAMQSLSDSIEDTKMYREQMGSLRKNLTAMNQVYGSMLAAMANPFNDKK